MINWFYQKSYICLQNWFKPLFKSFGQITPVILYLSLLSECNFSDLKNHDIQIFLPIYMLYTVVFSKLIEYCKVYNSEQKNYFCYVVQISSLMHVIIWEYIDIVLSSLYIQAFYRNHPKYCYCMFVDNNLWFSSQFLYIYIMCT